MEQLFLTAKQSLEVKELISIIGFVLFGLQVLMIS